MPDTLLKVNPALNKVIFVLCIIACAVLPVDPPIALVMGIVIALVIEIPLPPSTRKLFTGSYRSR
jgi:hypothetical protein